MKLIFLLVINIIGLIHIEARPQQIVIKQTSHQPVVNPPHLVPAVKAARPKPIEKSLEPRIPRQTSAVNPPPKKSVKLLQKPKPHMPEHSLPKSRSVAKPTQSFQPAQQQFRNERQVSKKQYNAPVTTYSAAPANTYNSAPLEALPTSIEARRVPSPQPSYNPRARAKAPIAITRYVYNSPTGEEQEGDDVFNYAYETQNGIKQSAEGRMVMVDETPVVVMSGSYEYVENGVTYEVVWVADENGFRASAPKSKHLPRVVAIPFPEQQAAVDAQIRFAQEENRLRAAASENPSSYAAGPQSLSGYSGDHRRV